MTGINFAERAHFQWTQTNGYTSFTTVFDTPGLFFMGGEMVGLLYFNVVCATPSYWATEQVNIAISRGLVTSTLQYHFAQATTRAEFTALAVSFYETLTGRTITGRMTFNDTTDINVQKMGYLGVVNGVGNGNFAPNDTITREQAAVMLSRLAAAVGQPLHQPSFQDVPRFADGAEISVWANLEVGQMQYAGIMSGVGNNRFAPQELFTREQSIITMLRLFDLLS